MADLSQFICNIKKIWNYSERLPEDAASWQGVKILHLSDTPTEIYGSLEKMLRCFKPDYVIHTGDLADEIKMGDEIEQCWRYQKQVRDFFLWLDQCTDKLFISPGNHDSIDMLQSIVKEERLNVEIVNWETPVEIEGNVFICDHYLENVIKKYPVGDWYLYGHNYDCPENEYDINRFLNGVAAVNILLLPGVKVYRLPYPRGTDYYRKYDKPFKLL